MGSLKLCCVAPHPPILVPEVGGPEAEKVSATARALHSLADEIEALDLDTVVIMSPHSPVYAEAFAVKGVPSLGGSLRQFGAPQVRYDSETDLELAGSLVEAAASMDVRCEMVGTRGYRHPDVSDLDHGVLVPMHFLARKRYPLVCISLSMLDYRSHYKLGVALRRAVEESGRNCLFVASGDMSHRLLPGAPAGYDPLGADFDAEIVEILSSGEFRGLFELDDRLVDRAGECGLRPVFTLAGAVDGYARSSGVLSYEGPFGVGYLVARVKPGARDASLSIL